MDDQTPENAPHDPESHPFTDPLEAAPAEDIIQKIQEYLTQYPYLNYESTRTWLKVFPYNDESFSVWINLEGDRYHVGYDEWHAHFDDEGAALDSFAYGVVGDCRLRIDMCGAYPYKYTVEERSARGWTTLSTVNKTWAPFWRKKSVVYKRNLPPADFNSGVST